MSIVLGVIVKDLSDNREMIFASDGRGLEHGTSNIRGEDFEKIRKLAPKICLGYVGYSGELFEDVYKVLSTEIRSKNLLEASYKLSEIIYKMLASPTHKAVENHSGPLNHQFIIGGFYKKQLKFYTLLSSNEFKLRKSELLPSQNVHIEIMGSSQEVHQKIKTLVEARLNHPQSMEEIVRNIRYIISKVAEQSYEINNHIFVRRISRNFELEKYIGYD